MYFQAKLIVAESSEKSWNWNWPPRLNSLRFFSMKNLTGRAKLNAQSKGTGCAGQKVYPDNMRFAVIFMNSIG